MPLNLPNTLTWLRILLIPVFLMFYYLPDDWMARQSVNLAAAGIFLLAAITDWLDGYLARKLKQTSAFGAFLDPVADKLMVAAALILLLQLGRVDAIVALVIIGREIAISALREWMAGDGQRKNVAVAFIGKVKTASQMIAILFLLYHEPLGTLDIRLIGTWLIYIAAVLTVVSMIYYIAQAFFSMRKRLP